MQVPSSDRKPYAALGGLDRAMLILEALADRPMRAKELAETITMKWTTVHRTLTYLRENGYLRRDPASGVYYIGSRLYYIGSSYVANLPILQASRPYLKAAADDTGATAQLVERDRSHSIVLLVFEPKSEYIPQTTIGYHFPLHCGSKGQVLLAHAESAFVEEYLSRPLESLTRHTITDPDDLRQRLAEIREHGYAVTRRDVQLTTGSAAAPVWDASGDVAASVTLIVDHARFSQVEETLVDTVLNAARSISLLMGWRPAMGATA
jgi:DNA-binding IclR family transcriptional regulator